MLTGGTYPLATCAGLRVERCAQRGKAAFICHEVAGRPQFVRVMSASD